MRINVLVCTRGMVVNGGTALRHRAAGGRGAAFPRGLVHQAAKVNKAKSTCGVSATLSSLLYAHEIVIDFDVWPQEASIPCKRKV